MKLLRHFLRRFQDYDLVYDMNSLEVVNEINLKNVLINTILPITIKKDEFRNDARPIDSTCVCSTCAHYTRKDLYAICRKGRRRDVIDKDSKFLYHKLATIHNLTFMHNLLRTIRESILKNTFTKLKKEWLSSD